MNKMIYILLTESIESHQRLCIIEETSDRSYSKYMGEFTMDEIKTLSEWHNISISTEPDTDTLYLYFYNKKGI